MCRRVLISAHLCGDCDRFGLALDKVFDSWMVSCTFLTCSYWNKASELSPRWDVQEGRALIGAMAASNPKKPMPQGVLSQATLKECLITPELKAFSSK